MMMYETTAAAAGGVKVASWVKPASIALLLVLALAAGVALASTSGSGGNDQVNSSFEELLNMLKGLMQGTLGSVIALALILCGGFISVRTQSLWGFVIGIAMALGMLYAPDIVTGIASATGAADPAGTAQFDPSAFDPSRLL